LLITRCEAVRLTTLAGRTTARILRCKPLSDRCPDEIALRRKRRPESAVEGQGTDSCAQRASAGKTHCVVLKFYIGRGKARRFA